MHESDARGTSGRSLDHLGIRPQRTGRAHRLEHSPEVAAALAEGEGAARELDALQRDYRAATLASVAPGRLAATDAFARIDATRGLDRVAHHAWRSAAHLLGRGGAGAI